MTGELEVELTDGTRRKIGSELVYLEDLTGRGHVTRALGPITNVFLHVPDDFDVVAWAAGAEESRMGPAFSVLMRPHRHARRRHCCFPPLAVFGACPNVHLPETFRYDLCVRQPESEVAVRRS
jgi:hypothetical protein